MWSTYTQRAQSNFDEFLLINAAISTRNSPVRLMGGMTQPIHGIENEYLRDAVRLLRSSTKVLLHDLCLKYTRECRILVADIQLAEMCLCAL